MGCDLYPSGSTQGIKKLSQYRTPTQTCIAGDRKGNDCALYPDQTCNIDIVNPVFQWELVHSGGTNILYLSGNIGWRKPPFPYGNANPFWLGE